MRFFSQKFITVLATLTAAVSALDGIVAPSEVAAGSNITVSFLNANGDLYRVYLAAALTGSLGPTCYLVKSTVLLPTSVTVSIPPGVGPSADYYSIAIADLTTGQASTFSNRFNLTGATGNYSAYENHLGGSPFWSADDLPCSAYPCARDCADASYPEDLTNQTAYDTMKTCILGCEGVTPAANQTTPAHVASSTAGTTATGTAATSAAPATVTTNAAVANNKAFFAGAVGFAGLAFFI